MEMEKFLRKITLEIKTRGFKQSEMAELLGLKVESFQNMLQNRTRFPVDVLMKINAILHVDMTFWFEESTPGRVEEPAANYEYRNKYYEHLERQIVFYEELLKTKFNYDCKNNDATVAHFVRDNIRGASEEGQPD